MFGYVISCYNTNLFEELYQTFETVALCGSSALELGFFSTAKPFRSTFFHLQVWWLWIFCSLIYSREKRTLGKWGRKEDCVGGTYFWSSCGFKVGESEFRVPWKMFYWCAVNLLLNGGILSQVGLICGIYRFSSSFYSSHYSIGIHGQSSSYYSGGPPRTRTHTQRTIFRITTPEDWRTCFRNLASSEPNPFKYRWTPLPKKHWIDKEHFRFSIEEMFHPSIEHLEDRFNT